MVPGRARTYGGEQVGAGQSENHPKSVKKSPWNGRYVICTFMIICTGCDLIVSRSQQRVFPDCN